MSRFDVVGIGNALVDVLSHETDEFLVEHGLAKGTMTLIDAVLAERLYAAMGPAIEMSGGSAANTMVGIASFGGRSAFVGRVSDDELGAVFAHDIRAAGVEFATSPASDGVPSGRCLVVVTPDAQRTLHTFLGASAQLGPADLDHDLVVGAQVLYLEGYLWDEPAAKDAFREAIGRVHAAGNRVAFTLSDGFCVDRHRAEFLELVERDVDVLFANEAEITALYEVREFDDALQGGSRSVRDRGPDPEREGGGDRDARGGARDRRASRRSRSSTPPAPATSLRRASCTGSPTVTTSAPPAASVRSPPPR